MFIACSLGVTMNEFFYYLVIVNLGSFMLMIMTSGTTRKFFAKVWGAVFTIFLIIIFIMVKSGQL